MIMMRSMLVTVIALAAAAAAVVVVVLGGSWDLVSKVIKEVIVRITPLRGLITQL